MMTGQQQRGQRQYENHVGRERERERERERVCTTCGKNILMMRDNEEDESSGIDEIQDEQKNNTLICADR